ncbi:hypothetical protein BC628DRAFT_1200857 [Trametes gibbosa]|nr:hypothetical protein BC628DRAFT_1200857 [Trametes gibbosa]
MVQRRYSLSDLLPPRPQRRRSRSTRMYPFIRKRRTRRMTGCVIGITFQLRSFFIEKIESAIAAVTNLDAHDMAFLSGLKESISVKCASGFLCPADLEVSPSAHTVCAVAFARDGYTFASLTHIVDLLGTYTDQRLRAVHLVEVFFSCYTEKLGDFLLVTPCDVCSLSSSKSAAHSRTPATQDYIQALSTFNVSSTSWKSLSHRSAINDK